ncbi:MAG: hypothetical protein ACYDCJ_08895 [Gammaproteobacteria bacterium]
MSIWFTVAMWRRDNESDPDGNPIVRYCGPRFSLPLCALIAAAVGLMELNNPVNYRYSGNLLILAYTPLAIAVLIFVLSIYFWTFRLTLKADSIERYVWPLSQSRYALKDLVSIEDNRPARSVLTFSDGRRLAINALVSGQAQFIDCLKSRTGK